MSGPSLIVCSPVPEATQASERRPGLLRRAAAGAWHVPAGFVFLLRRPRLWPLAVLPAALAAMLVLGGFVLGLFALSPVEAALAPPRGRLPGWLGFLVTLALWIATLGAGIVLGFAAALTAAAPILDRLSRLIEALLRGRAAEAETGLRWEMAQSLRVALYFLLAAPGVFLLGLIPLVGPAMGALWGAHALAWQQTDGPLARRGLDFRARRSWHRRWRVESLGFGAAGLIALVVPFANLLLAPALTVGATLLVLELEEGLVP